MKYEGGLEYVGVDGGDDINTQLKQIRCKCVGWAYLAEDRDEERET